MTKFSQYLLLSIVLLTVTFSAAAAESLLPSRLVKKNFSFKNNVLERFERIVAKDPIVLSENLKAILQQRVFVGYPGGIGLQSWVFYDNYEALRKDFGIPSEQMWHRDAIHGVYVSHNPVQGQWGQQLKHESLERGGVSLQKEAEVLRKIYELNGHKALIVFCHSGQCTNMLNTVLFLRNEIGEGKMIDRVVVMQGGFKGNSVGRNVSLADSVRKRYLLNQGLAAQELKLRNEEFFPNQPLSDIYYLADRGRVVGPQKQFGNFLGDLYYGHTEAVCSFDQTKPTGGQKMEYRQAFMQVLMETLYPEQQ